MMSPSPGATRRPLQVSYGSTPGLTSHLPLLLSTISPYLPLRNLHWKSASRTSLRTILEVPVEFVRIEELRKVPGQATLGPRASWIYPKDVEIGSLLRGPVVNVFFADCSVSHH